MFTYSGRTIIKVFENGVKVMTYHNMSASAFKMFLKANGGDVQQAHEKNLNLSFEDSCALHNQYLEEKKGS